MKRKEDKKIKDAAEEKHPSAKEEAEEIVSLEKEGKASKEYDGLWNKYLRLCAEFDNARKRWDREKTEVIKFANSFLLKDLLVILDEMQQALKMMKEHKAQEEIFKGLELMFGNFTSMLEKRGLKKIEAKEKPFDPHLHEIVAAREVDEDIEQPIVLEEVQKGYMLEGKVLRPARVIVAVKREAGESQEDAGSEKLPFKDKETSSLEKNDISAEEAGKADFKSSQDTDKREVKGDNQEEVENGKGNRD